VERGAQKDVAGDWTILRARRALTIKLWSLDARSEGQSSHPLVSEPFAHEWERGESIKRFQEPLNSSRHSNRSGVARAQ
jgi:hypothetical protein